MSDEATMIAEFFPSSPLSEEESKRVEELLVDFEHMKKEQPTQGYRQRKKQGMAMVRDDIYDILEDHRLSSAPLPGGGRVELEYKEHRGAVVRVWPVWRP